MWAQGSRRTVGAVALTVLLALGVLTMRWLPAGAQAPGAGSPPPGALVVAIPSLGQVNAILSNGEVQVLARGLSQPAGVAALADGTVLVAETGANRVSGFGGGLGPIPVPIVEVPAPTGLVAGPDGDVFVTIPGEVGRIDVATRQYTTLAGGFVSPSGPAVGPDVLYVPDFATGEVRRIGIETGADVGTAASGLRAPTGAASAPGLPLFVTEFAANTIVRIDPSGGVPSPFVTFIQGPSQLTFDPAVPAPGSDWTLVAGTTEGIVRFDQSGRVVGSPKDLPSSVGVAVTPDPNAAASAAPTPAGTTTVLKDEDSSSNSSLVVLVGLVVLAAIAVAGLTVFFARRAGRREREDDGLMAAPPESDGVSAAFGSCAEEEMELDRLQELLRHVAAQLEESQTRLRRTAELASGARDRAMRALEVRTSVQTARMAAKPPPTSERLTWAQLSFSTDEGRDAFESFRRRDMSPAQLKARLSELGETTALIQITEEGRRQIRSDPTVPWPEERQAVRDAITAREELRSHGREATEARSETVLLSERQRELTAELEAARQRLDDCRRARPDSSVFGDF
jgi:hypothetical protein